MQFAKPDLTSHESFFIQISNTIKDKIKNGEFSVGDKIPPERELCKIFNVSLITIKEAMANLEKRGYISRRRKLGTLVINTAPARCADFNKKNEIVVLVCPTVEGNNFLDTFSQPRHQKMIEGMEQKAKEKGVHLFYCSVKYDVDKLMLADRHKDSPGLIMIGDVTPKILRAVKSLKIPLVLTGDLRQENLTDDSVDIIANNDFESSYIATKHLIGLGHRRIGYVAESLSGYPWFAEKFRGYEAALKEAGIVCDRELEVETGGAGEVDETFIALKKKIDESVSFTALVCQSAEVCFGALNALKYAGLRMPEDVSMVGLGGFPGLTEVTCDTEDIGKASVERLIEILTISDWKPKRIIVPYKFIDRGSTRKVENTPESELLSK